MIVEETKKERKAKKKLEKQQRREELLATLQAQQRRPDLPPVASSEVVAPLGGAPAKVPRGVQKLISPVARTLASDRTLTATKASFLIAINCLMLSVTAHSLYSNPGTGSLWLALIPLALTNILSLAFAVWSAQVREEPTALDQVLALPGDQYEPALAHLLESREQVFHTLGNELHLHGAELVKSRRHLRTAYNVLLGGVALTAVTFALCFAFDATPKDGAPAAPVAGLGSSR